MQFASAEYREAMNEHFRSPSYVWVYLGVVNQKAQSVAYVRADLANFVSFKEKVTNSGIVESQYATLEDKQFKLDGSVSFEPDTEPYAFYQGIVTELPMQPITFVFGTLHEVNIKGLTIDFTDVYPTEFDVTNGETSHTYAPKQGGKFTLDDTFSNCSYITIIPRKMVGGNQRMRIASILFGVGLQFTNKEIINTTRRNMVDHISSQLPMKQFTFSVDNAKLKLNRDNPESFANYLEEKQECIFEYGRTLKDGTIERIPGGRTLLKTWSSNDQQARFSTVGRLDYMLDTFYKGQYFPTGITAYDLAEVVLQDAGETSYVLDQELKNVIIYNPLPIDTHKACLQLIANACRAILYEDRNGNITIRTSILPTVESTQCNVIEDYSSAKNLMTNKPVYDYATLEHNYFRLDGSQYFMSEEERYLPSGFVSKPSNASGLFAENPYIQVNFITKATINGLSLTFGDVYPTEFTVEEYSDDALVNTYVITDISKVTSVSNIFINVDAIRITFTKTNPIQRIHLNRIELAGNLDYEVTYRDMKESPISTGLETVSNINVYMYQYGEGENEEILQTADVVAGNNLIMLADDSQDLSVSYADEEITSNVEIIESGVHYAVVYASVEGTINITGKRFGITENVYKLGLHESGTEKELKNELISNRAVARGVAVWLGEYFNNDIEYDVTYRGDPILDCDDVVYLENKYVARNLVRITEETLSTSGGISLSCKLTARRVSYVDRQSVVGQAVVGTAIVGKSATS